MFLLIFGFIFGGSDPVSFNVAVFDEANNEFSQQLLESEVVTSVLEFADITDRDTADEKLIQTEIEAIITLPQDFGADQSSPSGRLVLEYLQSNEENAGTLVAVMDSILNGVNQTIEPYNPALTLDVQPIAKEGLDPFDYVASGLFGFSILSLAIFGMAQGFTADKKTGAIARLQAAPVKAWHVVLSTGITYIVIALLSIAILIAVAVIIFDYNMVGNWLALAIWIIFSTIVLFGLGLIVGGWAKNENQAAPAANLISFPMMFLSGVFFPRFIMPDWLQDVSQYLALTPVNEGLRLITAEGQGLSSLGSHTLVLLVWGVVSYAIAFKIFRWQ